MSARALVIGLDGADLDVIASIGAERLPHLHAQMARGAWARLRSVLPPATLPNWTTFLTGVDLGLRISGPSPSRVGPAGEYPLALELVSTTDDRLRLDGVVAIPRVMRDGAILAPCVARERLALDPIAPRAVARAVIPLPCGLEPGTYEATVSLILEQPATDDAIELDASSSMTLIVE